MKKDGQKTGINRKKLLTRGIGLAVAGIQAHAYADLRTKGMWRNTTALFSAFEPADLDLYRSLIRPPMEMPETPMVLIFMFDYHIVEPKIWGCVPYLEYTFAISVKYNGKEGGYILTMPVNKVPPLIGVPMSFPKYIPDEMSMGPSGRNGGWEVFVRDKGETLFSMDFTPGLTREMTPEEDEIVNGSAFDLDMPIWGFVPPLNGPIFLRVLVDDVVPSKWERKELGMAKINVGQSEKFAGLVAPDTEAVTALMEYTGGCLLVFRVLGVHKKK